MAYLVIVSFVTRILQVRYNIESYLVAMALEEFCS